MSAAGSKWTVDEDECLLSELKSNYPILEIAEHHQRSVGGIIARQKLLASQMLDKGIPIARVIAETRLTEETLNTFRAKSNQDDLRVILHRIESKLDELLKNEKN